MSRDPSKSSPPAATANSALRTAEALVDELKVAMQSLPPKEREALLAKLPAAAGGSSPGLSLSPLTLKILGIPENTAVDVNRLAPCFSAMIEFLLKLDDTAWGTWRGIRDSKSLKREVQIRALLKAMLRGNAKLTVRQVEFQIAQLMRLAVELLGQMNKVGALALRSQHKLRPDKIRPQIEARRSAISLTSSEAQCWELYSELWSQQTEQSLQRAINKELAKIVSITVKVQALPV